MNKKNRCLITILIIFITAFAITPIFLVNPSTNSIITNFNVLDVQELMPKTSQFIPRTIRIAIYNEPNTTRPDYATTGLLGNDYTGVKALLEGEGYQVFELTTSDIKAHELMTADYDIFLMVDNLPRESITNFVKEFWLGGGGIMSFDSAISYICYAGMIPPESEGLENYGVYWNYSPWTDTSSITVRHPITKEYQINDIITETYFDWAAFDWAALMTSSAALDFVNLATKQSFPNDATVVGHDPSKKGGRVVQMFGDGDIISVNREDIIIDAVEWLCPRPKGRILFDLSSHPRLGVDSWDTLSAYPGYFSLWRDGMVSRSFTFDKLYPSAAGNLTSGTLIKYDVLIIVSPDSDISASDRTAVTNWIANGGSLIALGDNPTGGGFNLCDQRINFLLTDFDLEINLVTGYGTTDNLNYIRHPTTEDCTYLNVDWRGTIDVTGSAFPIWHIGVNVVVAGQEYGNGRVILISDMNWITNTQINNQDNRQYGVNVINWLTASTADVLVYIDNSGWSGDPNANLYKGPVAIGLNDLDLSFYLTFTQEYFNLSLHEETWKLVIIDNIYYYIFGDDELNDALISHVENGGYLIMSSWTYGAPNSLFDYSGFHYAGNLFTSPPTIYIWDNTHNIFNFPAPYSANYIDSSFNFVGIECMNLTLYNNATAIAGLTSSQSDDGAAIIIGAYGRVITNAMLLTTYYDDTDDSTYPDALEIWENEIMFIIFQSLSIDIISPLDSEVFGVSAPTFSLDIAGYKITDVWYTINDGPNFYVASLTGIIDQTAWDALPDGIVSLKFYVEDYFGNQKFKEVIVIKEVETITVTRPDTTSEWETESIQLITWISTGSITAVKIELFKDDLFELEIVASTTDDGEYNWTIPSGLDDSTQYQIKISDVSNPSIYDYSAYFEITTPPPPDEIPGYDLFILIGFASLVSLLLIKKKLKK